MEKLSLNEVMSYLKVPEGADFAKIHVTPKQARSLMKRCNRINRGMNRQYIDTLRRDMENNHWYNDVDCIGFNKDGAIVNGQHRLKALSEANVESVELNFAFGVEQHIAMDIGRNRSNADQAKIFDKMGMSDNIVPNLFKTIIQQGLKLNGSKIRLSNSELLDLWTMYRDRFNTCVENEVFDLGTKASAAVVKSSLFWAYLSGVNIQTITQIAKVLRTGINETAADFPVIRLRDMLSDLRGNGFVIDEKRAKYTQQTIFNVTKGSTSSRLPTYIALHYQSYDIFNDKCGE